MGHSHRLPYKKETDVFKKKESAPKPLAAVQFLTPEYLIDGYLEDLSSWPFDGVRLTSVRFEPTGTLTPAASTAASWYVLNGSQVVAALPRDETSLAYTRKTYRDDKYPVPVEIYVGHYLIQGLLLQSDEEIDPEALIDAFDDYVLVQEAVIDCLLPGARLKHLSVPLAVVRTDQLLQGIVVLP
jgi:hypothetical protein